MSSGFLFDSDSAPLSAVPRNLGNRKTGEARRVLAHAGSKLHENAEFERRLWLMN